ncbi:MAG TPA: NmrA family NAD(P)-binding protein [Humisphaera sp.]|nr:NmrA family NAD(P)-binding protein [Humisphaera sp.]
MYVITGITGKVGGEVARTLLKAGNAVRAVVRDPRKGAQWDDLGCEVAIADMNDAAALTAALSGAGGVFVVLPPVFDPSPDFPQTRATVAALRKALDAARPARVVCISTIGAQAKRENLLTQLSIMEQSLGNLTMPITFLRPAWFMENSSWDVASARDSGVIASFLQPLDKPVPMVATADVGRVAAELLQENWAGRQVFELEGPTRVSPNEIAATFAQIIGHPVRAEVVPRERWEELFRSQGMKHPEPRMRMLDGFNEGWIEFEHGELKRRKGRITLKEVLKQLVNGK